MVIKGRCIVKTTLHNGTPKLSDFRIIDKNYAEELGEGEILTEALLIGVDRFQEGLSTYSFKAVDGFQLSKVVKSNNAKYPVGSIVYNQGGWQSISRLADGDVWNRIDDIEPKIDPMHYMGAVGMPGLTAYFSLHGILGAESGETVMVSDCSGAIGSMAGQIAKLEGCTVIGSCSSDEEAVFAKSIGYDGVLNCQTEDCTEALKNLAPDGIDCYFDNVGGEFSSCVRECMNNGGRMIQPLMMFKQLGMEGFIATKYFEVEGKKEEAYENLVNWVSNGDIKCKETIYEGFESLPQAFVDLFLGKDIGKVVVKI